MSARMSAPTRRTSSTTSRTATAPAAVGNRRAWGRCVWSCRARCCCAGSRCMALARRAGAWRRCMTRIRPGSACANRTLTMNLSAATNAATVTAAGTNRAAAPACKAAVIGGIPASAAIASAAAVNKPVPAPAVAIAPAGPWSHAQKDAIVKVSRPIKAHRRTGIRSVVVIAIRADRRNADPHSNHDLRWSGWRHGQPGKQGSAAK